MVGHGIIEALFIYGLGTPLMIGLLWSVWWQTYRREGPQELVDGEPWERAMIERTMIPPDPQLEDGARWLDI